MNQSFSNLLPATPENVASGATLLKDGKLVAFPTETVYGLGADAGNPAACAKIFAAKHRPANHPLIVHTATVEGAAYWYDRFTPGARKLFETFAPGPLTLILKRSKHASDTLTGGQDSVAVRIPSHPVAHALLAAFEALGGHGVAAPSANRFGHVSPTAARHVADDLGDSVDLILDGGDTDCGIESTILALTGDAPLLLRPGAVTKTQLEEVLGRPVALHASQGETTPRASGTLKSHYAPLTPATMVPVSEWDGEVERRLKAGQKLAFLTRTIEKPSAPSETKAARNFLRLPEDPAGYAHGLYAALRDLDECRADAMLIEALPDGEAWRGARDRLNRATYKGRSK
jgi:L-threonylcarbamoyladenylate synthase